MSITRKQIANYLVYILENNISGKEALSAINNDIYIYDKLYQNLLMLKDLYNKISLIYKNPDDLKRFLLATRNSALLNRQISFHRFKDMVIFIKFYSLFVNIISIEESKNFLLRSKIIQKYLDMDRISSYVIKYDYYFRGTVSKSIELPHNRNIDYFGQLSKGIFITSVDEIRTNIWIPYMKEEGYSSYFYLPRVYKTIMPFLSREGRDMLAVQYKNSSSITIWDIVDRKLVLTIQSEPVDDISILIYKGVPLIVVHNTYNINLINSETGMEEIVIQDTDFISSLCVFGNKIAVLYTNKVLKLWDINFPYEPIMVNHYDKINNYTRFNPVMLNNKIIFQSFNGEPYIWNTYTNQIQGLIKNEVKHTTVSTVLILSTGVITRIGDTFDLFDADLVWEHTFEYIYTKRNLEYMDVLPNNQLIASNGTTVVIWDISTGKITRVLNLSDHHHLKVLSDGTLITILLKQINPLIRFIQVYE